MLFQRSFARRVKLKYDEFSPILSAGFRATFGIVLITSIVFIAIVLSSTSSSTSEKDNNKQSQSSGLRLDLYDIIQSVSYAKRTHHRNTSNMSFLDACYSYLFGDGDPNEGGFITRYLITYDSKLVIK